MKLYIVLNKSAYRSLLSIDNILFVKTIFDFKPFFIAGYPANETGYPAGYRILKRPDIRSAGYPGQL